MLWIQYFCLAYGWYFYITWLPTYLIKEHGMPMAKGAAPAALPLFCGGVGCLFSSWILERFEQRLPYFSSARRVVAIFGFLSAGVMLAITPLMENPVLIMIVLGLASFFTDHVMPSSWGACMDMGGKYVGSLSGSMNMMGNVGGVLAPIVVSQILKFSGGNRAATFWVSAGMYLLGAICWIFIDPISRFEGKE